ncbi:5'/3'-nucleotidase SurE [Marmoricola sp. RAF53]|uniref:5'/3'-nucleotidase SurE n=1 Tax=Marmoricola sp. RAF53 TaxID=3233059 RepID=UPI003F969AA1
MRSTFSPARARSRFVALGLALATAASVLVAGAATGAATAAGAPDLHGLRVLITNDDSARGLDAGFGTDGKGLYELRKAFCAAGADVLVVAPWSQQSGAGARMTSPGFAPVPLTVQAVTPPAAYAGDCAAASTGGAVFGVCQSAGPCSSSTPTASPADAVNVALSRFAKTYWADGPDLVLSGVNFGQNVGATLNHSGTVGAAVTAREYGVPAFAFSAEVPRDLAQIPFVPFAQTAAFATDLVAKTVRSKQLKPGLVLNVNYPFVAAGETLGKPVSTVAGTSNDIGLTFNGDVPRTGGTYQLSAGTPAAETRKNADTTALAANRISVTRLDGDWTWTESAGLLTVLLTLFG